MSNTEDTQRIEGLNPGDKAYILTEEQYIKFEKQNAVIADLKFKLKNDAIFQEYSDLEKELASLREQLKQKDDIIKELILELIPIAEERVNNFPDSHSKLLYKSMIDKAKSLTTKDK